MTWADCTGETPHSPLASEWAKTLELEERSDRADQCSHRASIETLRVPQSVEAWGRSLLGRLRAGGLMRQASPGEMQRLALSLPPSPQLAP